MTTKSLYTDAQVFKITTAKGKNIDHFYDFESIEEAIAFIQNLGPKLQWELTMVARSAGKSGEDVYMSCRSKDYKGVFYD